MSISEKEKQLIVELCKGIGNLQTTVLTTRACQIAEYLHELPGSETTHAGIVHERDAAQDRERQLREALQHIAKHADDPVTREIARAALAASPTQAESNND